jgi:hypothetical protein
VCDDTTLQNVSERLAFASLVCTVTSVCIPAVPYLLTHTQARSAGHYTEGEACTEDTFLDSPTATPIHPTVPQCANDMLFLGFLGIISRALPHVLSRMLIKYGWLAAGHAHEATRSVHDVARSAARSGPSLVEVGPTWLPALFPCRPPAEEV